MKPISIRLPAEILHQLEWSKIYLKKQAPIKYTTTDVIIYAIATLYKKLYDESNKMDS